MNWDALGSIGEVIGALAVVATLGYLAHQTRMNTKAVLAAASSQSTLGFAEFDERIAKDPDLRGVIRKSLQPDLTQFSEIEWDCFQFFARSQVGRMQNAFLQSQIGFYQNELADVQLNFMRSLLEFPAWRAFWDNDEVVWTEGFRKEVARRKPVQVGMLSLTETIEQQSSTKT